MEMYVMCATSDSGDSYCCAKAWDHKPSTDEVNKVRVELDSVEVLGNHNKEDDEEFVVLSDGTRHISYINQFTIKKIEL